jgi:hypothetical protein
MPSGTRALEEFDEWNAFLARVQDGEFDLPSGSPLTMQIQVEDRTYAACCQMATERGGM